jgi:hypothetical protein
MMFHLRASPTHRPGRAQPSAGARRHGGLALLAVGALTLLACDQPLTLSRLDENFSTSQADTAMAAATGLLQTSDASYDVACPVRLLRQGTQVTYYAISNKIWTDAEVTRALNTPGYVKVVHLINRCGKQTNPGILGCAPQGRPTMIVEDLRDNDTPNPALEGVVWAHEFGHTQGLPHRSYVTSCPTCEGGLCYDICAQFPPPPADTLMGPFGSTISRVIDEQECNAFLVPRKEPLAPPTAPCQVCEVICYNQCNLGYASIGGPHEPERRSMEVRDFVRQVYIDALPMADAMRYGPREVPVVAAMLADPRERDHGSMATTVLGAIGNDAAVRALIDFVMTERRGRLRRAEYAAIGSALVALGYAVERTGNERALGFLMDASETGFWERRMGRRWTSAAASTAASRNSDLRNFAIMGLGMSAHEKAWNLLEQRWQDLDQRRKPMPEDERQALMGLLEQSMDDHSRVRRFGLAAYYGS